MSQEVMAQASLVWAWMQTTGLHVLFAILKAAVIFAVGKPLIALLARGIERVMSRTKLGKTNLVAKFVVSVTVKTAWAFLIVIILATLGVEIGPIIAGLGVTGFVLGFAFQESLGSFAAGLMLALDRPFNLGDYVLVAGHEGSVVSLDMMAVVLATGDNRKVTIPNRLAWGAPIVNYSSFKMRRVDLTIGIAYGADINKARETALATLAAMPEVMPDPAPQAEVKSLDDSAIVLTVRGWVRTPDYWSVFFKGNRLMKEAFDAAGIPIPFPQIDVHMV